MQNGLNSYNGCEDADINGRYSYTKDENYGDSEEINVTNVYYQKGLIRFKIFESQFVAFEVPEFLDRGPAFKVARIIFLPAGSEDACQNYKFFFFLFFIFRVLFNGRFFVFKKRGADISVELRLYFMVGHFCVNADELYGMVVSDLHENRYPC